MRANLDAVLSVRETALWCTMARGTRVTTHMVNGWVTRYGLTRQPCGGLLFGDVVKAETRARTSDKGAGRGRPKAA